MKNVAISSNKFKQIKGFIVINRILLKLCFLKKQKINNLNKKI